MTVLGIAVDTEDNIIVADCNNDRLRKISPNGVTSTLAAGIGRVTGVAVDGEGNVFFSAEQGISMLTPEGRVRPLDIAGPGLGQSAMAVDSEGRLFVADPKNHRILLLREPELLARPADLRWPPCDEPPATSTLKTDLGELLRTGPLSDIRFEARLPPTPLSSCAGRAPTTT